jgi:hypothetical protein
LFPEVDYYCQRSHALATSSLPQAADINSASLSAIRLGDGAMSFDNARDFAVVYNLPVRDRILCGWNKTPLDFA